MAPTMPPVTTAMTVEAETRDRIFQVAGGTRGAGTRRSIR